MWLKSEAATRGKKKKVLKKGVPKNIAKFTVKHLCQSLFLRSCRRQDCSFTKKLHKENNRNNKNIFEFLIFHLLFSFFFFSDFTFYKEALCFIIFIFSLRSNTLTLESILEYMRQKFLKKICSF